MNMFNELPYEIEIDGKAYPINTNFRIMISFETKIMQGIELLSKQEQNEIILETLIKFCPAFFENNKALAEKETEQLIEKLLWFYTCGRENYHKGGKGDTNKNQTYSYEYDDDYIFGAFYEQYHGLDLTTTNLHWWKFKSLFLSLKDDTKFEQIKSYRAYTGKDKDMLKMKKYWTLPLNKKEQEIEDEITQRLMNFKKEEGD